jgi:hypothetical protein
MDKIGQYFKRGVIIIFSAATALGIYNKLWIYNQPKQKIEQALVTSITPYYFRNDLMFSSDGYNLTILTIRGENKFIDISSNNWDNTVKKGDLVDLVVKPTMLGSGLDGLAIDDHK